MNRNRIFNCLIVSLVCITPLIAFAAEPASSNPTTKWITQSFFLLALLWGAGKSFALAKNENTSATCVYSLGVALLGLSIFTGTTLLIENLSELSINIIRIVAALIIFVSFIVAIVGLIQYQPHHSQGRRQAISTVIIGLIFLGLVGYGAYTAIAKKFPSDQVSANAKAEIFHFDEFNFHFEAPNAKYIKVKPETINEDAAVVLTSVRPKLYFLIIPELIGLDVMSIENLKEIVLVNLKAVGSDIKVLKTENQNIGALEGLRLDLNVTVSGIRLSYSYWLYEKNGFVYQMIAWSKKKNRDKLNSQFDELLSGFSLISNKKIALDNDGERIPKHQSDTGYSIDLEDSAWVAWTNLDEDYPLSPVGGEIGHHSLFLISPFCYGKDRPHDSAIMSALLQPHDITYPNHEIKKNGTIKLGDLNGQQYSYQWERDGSMQEARLTSFIENDCAHLILFWTGLDKIKADDLNKELLSNIKMHSMKSAKQDNKPNNKQDKNLATLYNRSGLYYFENKNFSEALRFFKLAQQNDISSVTYTNNMFEAWNKINAYQEGVDYFILEKNKASMDAETYSWQAWFFENLKQFEQAEKKYLEAFSQGYKNDDDLGRYLDMLLEKNQIALAENSIEKFADNKESLIMIRKFVAIKRAAKKYDEAFELLDKAEKNTEMEVELVFDRIYLHQDLGEQKTIIQLAQTLIDAGHASAGAYYQKGLAEYELHWYKQAKQSFEEALKLSPNNETITEYLTYVTNMLGQGESTSISTPIKPVNIPATAKPSNIDDSSFDQYDSFYTLKSTAFKFNKNRKSVTTYQRNIKILSPQGVERFSTLEFEFDPFYEKGYVNKLLVKDEKNNVIYEGNRQNYYVTDSESEYADTEKLANIPVGKLAVGNTIEFQYSIESLNNVSVFPYERIFLSSSRPVIESIVYVTGDIKDIHTEQLSAAKPDKTKNSLLWKQILPQPYVDEPMQISSVKYLPVVYLNHIGQDWEKLGADYLTSIKDKLNVSVKVNQLASSLTKGMSNVDEKIVAVVNYVQKNITYKAIEFGVRGRIPNTANNTVNTLYGDCKDHAVLVHSLLKALNIDSNLALASLSNSININQASIDQFDHMIVYLPNIMGGQFIDATDKNMSLVGRAPASLGDSYSLILDSTNTQIKKIPDYVLENNKMKSIRNVQIHLDNKATIQEKFILSGYTASSLRSFLRTIELGKQLNWAQAFMSDQNKKVTVKSFQVSDLYKVNAPLTLEFEYTIDSTKLDNGNILFEDASLWEYYYLIPTPVATRKTDFEINYPVKFESQINITLPKGYVPSIEKAKDVDDNSKFGNYSLKWNSQDNLVIKTFILSKNKGSFSKTDYQDYVDFNKKAVNLLAYAFKISPKNSR